MVVPASPGVCSCTSEIYYSDLKLIQLKLTSLAEIFVLKSVHPSLMQLSVANPVLMEVPALLLVDAPVLLNGLDPLVQLVRQSCVNTVNPIFTSYSSSVVRRRFQDSVDRITNTVWLP